MFCLHKSHFLHQSSSSPRPRSASIFRLAAFSFPLKKVHPEQGCAPPTQSGSSLKTRAHLGLPCYFPLVPVAELCLVCFPGTRGCRRSLLASGKVWAEHGHSRCGFSWGQSCMGMARGQVLSCLLPRGAQGLTGLNQPSGPQLQLPGRAMTPSRSLGGGGWFLACTIPHTSCGLCLGWWQEDNHNYYVSRLYGPSEPRSRELWVDVAKSNRSQVKVHRILSNTHRQASVSAQFRQHCPGLGAGGWRLGANPPAWLMGMAVA